MQKFYLIILLILGVNMVFGQAKKTANPKYPSVNASTLTERQAAAKQKEMLQQNSIFKEYPIRSIGPCTMGGRIVDVAVNQRDNKKFYVAYASGGVFKTDNNGQTFTPIFDNQARLTVGDIELSPANENLLWVGTGENNSSRSSYAGFGVYKSEDGGKSWIHCGLENTQHIGRVVAHPSDVNTAWVASIGALYSKNTDRGVYKTTDGGKTWRKTLYLNDSTGVIELIVNPLNPKQLWAGAWERARKSWDFKENGAQSGLYLSEDGGETWTRVTNGLPEAKYIGRIGLDIALSQPNTLYMVLDNQEKFKKAEEPEEDNKLKFKLKDFEKMAKEDFSKLNEADLDSFLLKSGFPSKYKAKLVKEDVQKGKYLPSALSNYFKNANDDLVTGEVKGAEVYRSDDGGKSWRKMNTYHLEGVFSTYGYYFAQIRVSPLNPEVIYIHGVPFLRSEDGGKTFKSIAPFNKVHADHHALWINPKDDNHIILGNDGGLYLSYDRGNQYWHINNVAVGQFYTVDVDMEKPYNVYGGLQDNGVYMGSSLSAPDDPEAWKSIMGGDGMYVQVNPKNSKLIYTGFQFGNHFRLENGKNTYITPKHDLGEAAYRFNWRSPVILSKHNPDVVYFASNKLLRSMNKGDNWEVISGDLTKNLPQGDVPFSTISSFAESPLKFGLLYVGTDDGNVWLSKNGGGSWESIAVGLPADRWVSSIFSSAIDEKTVFISLTGYRFDEIKAYIYKSSDYGKTWTSIKGNLPDEAVNVIAQDAVNSDLLYCGTDEGAYLSLNGGVNWQALTGDFPNVATYDLIVHPRDNELVLATHGRSFYVMDVKPLQKMTGDNLKKPIIAYKAKALKYNKMWGKSRTPYSDKIEPKVELMYYLPNAVNKLNVIVKDANGLVINTLEGKTSAGFHTLKWNASTAQGAYLSVGKYTLEFTDGRVKEEMSWEINK
jgi:photosystem II stability/assembly factor-like uncharacterized protein